MTITDESLVRTIREATESVFSVMLGLPVEVGTARRDEARLAGYDGVISLVSLGGNWIGSGRIACGSGLACRISSALLMAEYVAVNEDVLDAMGELANMIVGNVKTVLEETLGPLVLSIPTVIFGHNYYTRSSGVKEWLVVPFQCRDDRMEIHFFLTQAPEPASVRLADLAAQAVSD